MSLECKKNLRFVSSNDNATISSSLMTLFNSPFSFSLWLHHASISATCVCSDDLPDQLGPALPSQMLQQVQQACLDAASKIGHVRAVWDHIDSGDGNLCVYAYINKRHNSKRLPFLETSNDGIDLFWNLLRQFLQSLQLVGLYQAFPPQYQTRVKRLSSSSTNSAVSANSYISLSMSADVGDVFLDLTKENIEIIRCKPLSKNISQWSVLEVEWVLCNADPLLSTVVAKFREHDIDGHALLLLNSNIMVQYMGLDLKIANKIASIVKELCSFSCQ